MVCKPVPYVVKRDAIPVTHKTRSTTSNLLGTLQCVNKCVCIGVCRCVCTKFAYTGKDDKISENLRDYSMYCKGNRIVIYGYDNIVNIVSMKNNENSFG